MNKASGQLTIALSGLLGGFLCIFAVAALHAQESAASDAERLALAREFAPAIQPDGSLKPMLIEEISSRAPAAGENPTEFEATRKIVISNVEKVLPQFRENIIAVYARSFSDSEMTDLIQFYRSPTCIKLAERQREVSKQSFSIVFKWMGRVLMPKSAQSPETTPQAADNFTAPKNETEVGREFAALFQSQLQQLFKEAGEEEALRRRLPELIDEIGNLYSKNFTPQELEELIRFYKTSRGHKVGGDLWPDGGAR